MGTLTLLLCLTLWWSSAEEEPEWFQNITTNIFSSSGDIRLAGYFEINRLTSNLTKRRTVCFCLDRVNEYGLALAIVMKFSVDKINAQPNLLPGVKLGYELFDTCKQTAIIMRPTMFLITEGSSGVLPVMCNYTHYVSRAVAVIGPYSSEIVSVVGQLLGFFLLPLVSYGATSDTFSDKNLYPSFMRTVPSDRLQAEGMVRLLKEFNWNWVAVIASEDEYGTQGQQQFSSMAADQSICVAYEGLIPIYTDPIPAIRDIIEHIRGTNVGVVVLFALTQSATAFFTEVIKRNLSAVWVGSTAWGMHKDFFTLPNVNQIGTVLAFADMTQPMDQLNSYSRVLLSRIAEERLKQPLRQPGTELPTVTNPCPLCWKLSLNNMSLMEEPLVQRTAFSVYTATYSVAQALHNMLGCTNTSCNTMDNKTIYSWQRVTFTVNGINFTFDENGNPNIGYNLLVWVWKNNNITFREIGTFYQELTIDKSSIVWHTGSQVTSDKGNVPVSTCSANCEDGQVQRVKGFFSCCFDCIDCKEGSFQNNSDDVQCTACPKGKWSEMRSRNCLDPTYIFFYWSSYESVGMIVAGLVVLASQCTIVILFLRHWGTPMVRASGGAMSIIALLCMMGCCASLLLFLGEPWELGCRLQLPLNAIFPTVTLSAILSMSLQIVCVTEFPERSLPHLHMLQGLGSWIVVVACCIIQAGLSIWFLQEAPTLSQFVYSLEVNYLTRFLSCPITPLVNFGIMLGFNGLLALLSFMCTFMALKPAGQYNLARDITVSTLAYCVVWVIFVPIYTGLNDHNKSIAHVSVTLISNLGLTYAYFLPKCYLLLKMPENNTPDHFRTFLEGAPPTPQED
uniref:Taste receptor type 1 member 3 n=1 Tax=Denticeps clupeoides TaxID=299321 RepID=A0AAY4CUY2_9TELE